MKKFVLLCIAVWSLTAVQAQTVKEVKDSVKAATKAGNIKAMASTVKGAFAAKSAKAEELVATWVYVEPAVLSTSNRMLLKMAGNAVAHKLEKMVRDYFNRAHVTAENTFFTFNHNGTYSRSLSGQKASGTWMTAGEQVLLAVKNVQTAAMVSHMENDTLTLVADLSKTLSDIQKLGGFSDSKANNTLLKLSKRLKGLKVGFLLARRKQ
jgi:hypothetical protein